MAAAQGIELKRDPVALLRSSPLIETELARIRMTVAFLDQDRYMAPDVEAMRRWALADDWPAPLRAVLPSHIGASQ
jgi:histidine ammonia-lyase